MQLNGYAQVGVLAIVNALAFAATPMLMLIGSLLGVEMAPSEDWATLPIALMVVGTALGVIPATRAMQNLGRKRALWSFITIGIIASLFMAQSLNDKTFFVFCIGAFLIGFTNAALQQIRYAAMESVAASGAATAASIIMFSSVISAVLGPELALYGRHLNAVEYQGAFYLIAICFFIAAVVLSLYTPEQQNSSSNIKSSRTVTQIIANPQFCLAVVSGVIGFAVMTFVMTGTPISMHHHFGHSLEDTKWVIQSHIAAMFLPSLFTPLLLRKLGFRNVMLAGLACYALTIVIGNIDTTVFGFWSQLVILGIGWNFLFISGTALLPSTYQQGEQYKAQSINDSLIFSIQAVASLSAGWVISLASWHVILLLCLAPMSLMLAVMIWSHYQAMRLEERAKEATL